jgi:hypothetical protein
MIDFVSTRDGTSDDTKRAAHLLSFLLVSFIRSASIKPDAAEKAAARNLNYDALLGIEYLFDENSTFEDHVEAIGGSPATMRAALLSKRALGPRSPFTEEMRRVIQVRHQWWAASKQPAPRDTSPITKGDPV